MKTFSLSSAMGTVARVVRHIWVHPANRGARGRALLRAVRFQLVGRLLRRPSHARVGSQGRMICYLHSNGASAMLYANPPDFEEMNFWRQFLHRGDLFVDLGSNVGTYAIWAGDSGAEVWAFEPDPLAFSRLKANLAINDFQIAAQQVALGAQLGQLQLTTGRDTTNRLVLNATDIASGATQDVPVSTLDLIVVERYVRGLKIDVEGAERLVVEGANTVLAANRIAVLQIEWNRMSDSTLNESRAPLLELMLGHGYLPFRPEDGHMEPVPLSDAGSYGADLFLVAPNMIAELP